MERSANFSSSMSRRVLTALACIAAFMVMASVFTPDLSRAGAPGEPLPRSVDYPPAVHPHHVSVDPHQGSVDPHEGLGSLGVIEDRGYTIHIFATEGGPRYTIYENITGSECGALLTEEQVHRAFPDLHLPGMEMLLEGLMLADPPRSDWR